MLVMQACSSSKPVSSGGATAAAEDPLASINFNLAIGFALTGKSVRICGARAIPADATYCDNVLPGDASGLAVPEDPPGTGFCPCFLLDDTGAIYDPVTMTPAYIDGLCPSTIAPASDWQIDYSVYDNATCMGDALNGPDGPLVCYDSKDLAAQDSPNSSIEPLAPSSNVNTIICISPTAGKDFQFLACGSSNTAADEVAGKERYNCGCTWGGSACTCPVPFPEEIAFVGCAFETVPQTCDIVCTPPVAPLGAAASASAIPSAAGANWGGGSASCPSGFFASCRTGAGSQLQSLDPGSISFSPLGSLSRSDVGALAFNPRDGFLYAISSRGASPGLAAPRLLRIDPHRGDAIELEALAQLAGAEWTSGAFLRDGTYVIGSRVAGAGGFRWAKLSIPPRGPAKLVATGRVQATGGTPTWWSAHPTDGRLYGYLPQEGQLVIFTPATNTLTPGARLAQIGPQQDCAGAFSHNGELLLYCGSSAAGGSSVFSVDVARGTADLVQSGLNVDVESLTSCSYQ